MIRRNKQNPNRIATDAAAYATETLGVQISAKTAGRCLNEAELHARRPARKPMMKRRTGQGPV
jgi:hypothetical protein